MGQRVFTRLSFWHLSSSTFLPLYIMLSTFIKTSFHHDCGKYCLRTNSWEQTEGPECRNRFSWPCYWRLDHSWRKIKPAHRNCPCLSWSAMRKKYSSRAKVKTIFWAPQNFLEGAGLFHENILNWYPGPLTVGLLRLLHPSSATSTGIADWKLVQSWALSRISHEF